VTKMQSYVMAADDGRNDSGDFGKHMISLSAQCLIKQQFAGMKLL
jgi:hypothetical protein